MGHFPSDQLTLLFGIFLLGNVAYHGHGDWLSRKYVPGQRCLHRKFATAFVPAQYLATATHLTTCWRCCRDQPIDVLPVPFMKAHWN